MFVKKYVTPSYVSNIIMSSDGEYLTGLWFENTNDSIKHNDKQVSCDLPIFDETKEWLDLYFSGVNPDFVPKYKINNLTSFRQMVIDKMIKIPYGSVTTYGDIAKELAKQKGLDKMSAQAVGNAVGWNPICIIIPCHRVVGTNLNLVGYGGGINNKIELLKLEGNDLSNYIVPKKGNKL